MQNINGSYEKTILFFIFVVVIVFFIVVWFYFNVAQPFAQERHYIKMEMARSNDEREYNHWKKELKRLYLAHIPIIGIFFR